MPRHFFNFQNGATTLDGVGVDLPDLAAVRSEAVKTMAAVLREDVTVSFWNGAPMRLWVTDEPDAAGNTLLEIRVTLGQIQQARTASK